LILLFTLPAATLSQKRKPTKSSKSRSAAPAPTPSDLRAEAAQAAEQLKLLTKFIYHYGKITYGLELADEQAKRGELSPAVQEKNQQIKQSLVTSISGLRVGLDKLGQSYQANPRLQVQYLKLLSASEAITAAEQIAAAGRYDEAGKVLIAAAERLADAVVAVR
jgi:hypothetical protein